MLYHSEGNQMRNSNSSQEFWINDKPISAWVAWPTILALVLLMIIALTADSVIIASMLGATGPLATIVVMLSLTGLPVHVTLRLFGRKGIYYIQRTEWQPVLDSNSSDDDVYIRQEFNCDSDEWRRSTSLGLRPWHEAIVRQ